ncbi:uncharacterized protein LOC128221697 [Mya arenaria]|uniref:uncharacterized protein LOC128221697 n=1 Tax=Mya arenaria TaxID=6604 RepID=UPI0022E7333E|nr:uncharacterized protein LOC128221697 [Mya arenaria]
MEVWIWFLVFSISCRWSFGLVCLQCKSIISPRLCKRVTQCSDVEVCNVQRQINEFGEYVYDLGCYPKDTCTNVTSLSQPSLCTQCCDVDLCNHVACNAQDYPAHRGPICYNCQNPTPTGRCHDIEFCDPNKICSVASTTIFGDTLYTSSCELQHTCKLHQGPGLIGKRETEKSRSSENFNVCDTCCSVDLCNRDCQTAKQRTNGQWTEWYAWGSCSDTCGDGVQSRNRTCTNPSPTNGGVMCPGKENESRTCSQQMCPNDCSDVLKLGLSRGSGVYRITPWNTHRDVDVYCEMDTEGGGWTVFQRRWNGSVAFNRSFADYEGGFGSLDGEFWIGLGLLHSITSRGNMTLRVDMSLPDGTTGFDEYAGFYISPPDRYTFNVDSRINSGGMSDTYLLSDKRTRWDINHQPFSTYDRDVDHWSGNCAQYWGGGWWYNFCMYNNLNGPYNSDEFYYFSFKQTKPRSLKTSTMMLRLSY